MNFFIYIATEPFFTRNIILGLFTCKLHNPGFSYYSSINSNWDILLLAILLFLGLSFYQGFAMILCYFTGLSKAFLVKMEESTVYEVNCNSANIDYSLLQRH